MPRSSLAFLSFAAIALAGLGCGPEYPACDTDSDCHQGEYCVNGQCQQCRNDGDCGPGRRCNDGRCDPIEGWCQSSADCPAGQECRDNACVAMTQTQTDVPQDTTPPPPPGPCQLQTAYFGFDSSELEGSTRDVLQSNANCIRERNITRVRVVGHCDPRGTEEYNLALGERRARAALQYMQSLGVDRGRMAPRSMGEEMARGTDESSWSQDRRVVVEEY